jgi:hypothetical protein
MCRMNRSFSLLLSAFLTFTLIGCNSPRRSGGQQQPERTVLVQPPNNEREATHLPQVVETLQRNGFTPVRRGYAQYEVGLLIETGPVNADATITLSQSGSVMAQARGRDGGTRIILNRSGVVANAVQKALQEFEPQLSHLQGNGYGHPQHYGDRPAW